MGLMDSIAVQYIWKAIQESERSDENFYSYATLSDRLFQAQCTTDALDERAPARSDGKGVGECSRLGQDQMPLSCPEGRLVDG